MTETPNYHLSLAENDRQTFLEWRNKINGQNNSDMMKIDAALKDIQDNSSRTGVSVVEVTLYANKWTTGKQQTVTVEGLTDKYDAIATLSDKNSDAAKKAALDADLKDVLQGNDSIVFKAQGTVPTKDIFLEITLVPAGLVGALDSYIGVGATKAADVSFDNSNVDMKATNVQDAIEELYRLVKGQTQSPPTPTNQIIYDSAFVMQLVYTGKSISPFGDITRDKITTTGVDSATNVGTYSMTLTPKNGYMWEDKTITPKNFTWSIIQGQSAIILDKNMVTLTPTVTSDTVSVKLNLADYFEIRIDSGSDLISTSVSDNTITIRNIGNKHGYSKISLLVYPTENYTGATKAIDVFSEFNA